MTTTTRTVQEQAFRPLECDIPVELTIAEYRSTRQDRAAGREERKVARPRLTKLLRR